MTIKKAFLVVNLVQLTGFIRTHNLKEQFNVWLLKCEKIHKFPL